MSKTERLAVVTNYSPCNSAVDARVSRTARHRPAPPAAPTAIPLLLTSDIWNRSRNSLAAGSRGELRLRQLMGNINISSTWLNCTALDKNLKLSSNKSSEDLFIQDEFWFSAEPNWNVWENDKYNSIHIFWRLQAGLAVRTQQLHFFAGGGIMLYYIGSE